MLLRTFSESWTPPSESTLNLSSVRRIDVRELRVARHQRDIYKVLKLA
jgi:hypothetical protein